MICKHCGELIEPTGGKLYLYTHVDPDQQKCITATPADSPSEEAGQQGMTLMELDKALREVYAYRPKKEISTAPAQSGSQPATECHYCSHPELYEDAILLPFHRPKNDESGL